jgi:hypothetical protein
MAFVDIQKALETWASGQTNYSVIWLNPNATRPALPYIALQILSLVKMGGDYISPVDLTGKRRIKSDYYINVNISCYFTGDGALVSAADVLADLRLSLRTEAVADYLTSQNVSLIKEISSILVIPKKVATGFEPRASIDIQFGTAIYVDELISTIDTVTGQGVINSGGDQITIDYESEV